MRSPDGIRHVFCLGRAPQCLSSLLLDIVMHNTDPFLDRLDLLNSLLAMVLLELEVLNELIRLHSRYLA